MSICRIWGRFWRLSLSLAVTVAAQFAPGAVCGAYRPAEGRILPSTPALAEKLILADIHAFPDDLKLTMISLQGIVNQSRPRIYFDMGGYDRQWAEWLKERGDTEEIESRDLFDTFTLIEDFRGELKGQVVVDPDLPATINVATMLAGLDGLLITYPEYSEEYEERYQLPISVDLTGKFKNSAEAYDWAWKNLWPRLSHSALSMLHPDIRGLRDYLIQQKIFVWWQSGKKDGPLFGNSTYAEKKVTLEILKTAPLNIPVLGYPWAGDGVGLGEQDGVTLFSRYGKFLIPLDHAANLSVHSGAGSDGVTLGAVEVSEAGNPVAPDAGAAGGPQPGPNPEKIYVSYVISDGDNLQAWLNFFRKYWDSPAHGGVPVGWTIGPLALELMPDVVDYLFRTKRPGDTFLCAVSGIGYVYLDYYGRFFGTQARDGIMKGFLGLTREYMGRLGLEYIWPMTVSGKVPPAALQLYADGIPELKALFPDYGQKVSDYSQANSLITGSDPITGKSHPIPVFRALGSGGTKIAQELPKLLNKAERPAFVHAFVLNWDNTMESLVQARDELGPDYVFVSPDQLARLYLSSNRR